MFFFFKQKTAYEMRISDWSSDVCSSDLQRITLLVEEAHHLHGLEYQRRALPAHLLAVLELPLEADGTDLAAGNGCLGAILSQTKTALDRKSVVKGKSVSVRVDIGDRRIIKNKTHKQITYHKTYRY